MMLLLALLGSILSCGVDAKETPPPIVVDYLRSMDGDTLVVELPGLREIDTNENYAIFWKEISVRIAGIDAPEIHGSCAQERRLAKRARTLVEKTLTEAKEVRLGNLNRDKYFRIVADVYADQKNVGQMMIEAQLAVSYYGGTKTRKWCANSNVLGANNFQ